MSEKASKTIYIAQLSAEIRQRLQDDIRQALGVKETWNEDLERAMNSRLGDLEDLIDIDPYLVKDVPDNKEHSEQAEERVPAGLEMQ